MKTKNIIILILINSLFLYGCQKDITKEETVTQVLELAFTHNRDDYESYNDDIRGFYDGRVNQVKNHFTDRGITSIARNRIIAGFSNLLSDYECTSTVESIELDFREQSMEDELVCYYEFNLIVNFEDTSIEPFTGLVNGVMTLRNVDDEWKIDVIKMTSPGSFYTGFYDHVND